MLTDRTLLLVCGRSILILLIIFDIIGTKHCAFKNRRLKSDDLECMLVGKELHCVGRLSAEFGLLKVE